VVFTTVIVTGLLGCELNISGRQLAQMTLLILSGVGAVLGYSHYLEKKAEKSVFDQEYKREKWYALNVKVSLFLIFLAPPVFFCRECDNYLEGEQKEMVELYVSKGMTQADAETVIKLLSKNEKMFVDIMMVEELGLLPYNDLLPLWAGMPFLKFICFVSPFLCSPFCLK